MHVLLFFNLFLTYSIQAQEIIKIATHLKANQAVNKRTWEKTKNLCKIYEKELPIRFVELNEADIIITDDFTNPHNKNKPLILIDKDDPAAIPLSKLELLKNERVKAYFAHHMLRPLSLNLSPLVHGCYHFSVLNNLNTTARPNNQEHISAEALKKIKLVPWTEWRNALRLENLKSEKINYQHESREIDVCFIGRSHHPGIPPALYEIYTWHRSRALEIVTQLKDLNTYIKITRHVTGSERLHFDSYMKLLKNSKIVVSPWGWGEWCWRDYEAIYSGAVLIKPDTSFVQAIPDVYQNNITYVPCKADFSDLEEKIRYVLNNYDEFKQMRKTARELLINYTGKEFITHFANSVVEAYYA